jgi:hypothetical protein
MCFAGTESLRVTVLNFSASEIPADNLFPDAKKATQLPLRKENKRRSLGSRHHPRRIDRKTNFAYRTHQCLLVRYDTQAPDQIIEHSLARETTEKDRW